MRFDLNDYSVPADRVRRTLVVVSTPDSVRVLDGAEEVARHVRCWGRGQQIEDSAHLQQLLEYKRNAREHRGMDRLAHAAPSSQRFLQRVAQQGGNLGSLTSRLLKLLDQFSAEELESALVESLDAERYHLGAVRQVIDRNRSRAGRLPPVSDAHVPDKYQSAPVRQHDLGQYDRIGKAATDD